MVRPVESLWANDKLTILSKAEGQITMPKTMAPFNLKRKFEVNQVKKAWSEPGF